MKNPHKQEAGDLIARLVIGPYANIWSNYDPVAVERFEQVVTKWAWVLRRDGGIVSLKADNLPEVKLSIEIEEGSETVNQFNRLPGYLDCKPIQKDTPPILLEVSAFPKGDEDFPYWTMGDDGDNTDTIIYCRDAGMILKSARDFWYNNNPGTLAEIELISSEIPDLPPY
jgi:hypothetical protein